MLQKNRESRSNFLKLIIFFVAIVSVSFLVRFNYIPFNIPIILDGFNYFLVANELAVSGVLPAEYNKPNTGWPLFLSLIFQIVRFENYIDYMNMQRIISVLFSSLTVIPIFYLSKKFFNISLAIIASTFFAFTPYIIENSVLGINDSLFIFLITLFFALFFNENKNKVMYSFVFLGMAVIIRYESLLLIIPATIIFLEKFRSEKDFVKFYFLGLALFLITVILMATWRMQMGISDGFISHIIGGANTVINEEVIISEPLETRFYFERGLVNTIKYTGALLLPICFLFVPYSIIPLIKRKNKNFLYLIFFGIFSSIAPLYAYGRGIEEVKYVFVLLPLLIIASLFLIEKIILKTKRNYLIVTIFIILIVITSVIFLELRKSDSQYLEESVEVARIVNDLPGKINDYGNESYYVEVMNLEGLKFPISSTEMDLQPKVKRIEGKTINEIIKNAAKNEISYLGITEMGNDNEILSDIYHEEEKYHFLEKIYDSNDKLEKFKIKIFKINFNEIDIQK